MRRCSFLREISYEPGHRDRRSIFSELSREIFARQEEIIGPISTPLLRQPLYVQERCLSDNEKFDSALSQLTVPYPM